MINMFLDEISMIWWKRFIAISANKQEMANQFKHLCASQRCLDRYFYMLMSNTTTMQQKCKSYWSCTITLTLLFNVLRYRHNPQSLKDVALCTWRYSVIFKIFFVKCFYHIIYAYSYCCAKHIITLC